MTSQGTQEYNVAEKYIWLWASWCSLTSDPSFHSSWREPALCCVSSATFKYCLKEDELFEKALFYVQQPSHIQHIHFSLFCIAQYHKLQNCLQQGFTICTNMTSLTFDLKSYQEKLPKNWKKTFQVGKKWRALQEINRDLFPEWTDAYTGLSQKIRILW